MKNKNFEKTAFSGVMWSYAERISAQCVSTIVSIILARILDPEHYGIISIVTIFISICNTFVTSGFGNSLIQKKDADELDFSTAFHFSLLIAVVMYVGLFFLSPLIAAFYSSNELTVVLRVMSLRIPIAAINSIQHAYVSKNFLFRKFFFSTLGGTLVSAVVGILLAFSGYGVWALVAQYMVNSITDTIVLFFTVPWKPRLEFSFKRVKGIYSFGWKLMVADIAKTLYNNLRGLIIGKKYSKADLSYYNEAQRFPRLIMENLNASIIKVLFPIMSAQQNDTSVLRQMTRRSIRIATYITAPLLIGLVVVSDPLISVILTNKWIDSVKYLQILSIAYLVQPINSANAQVVKAVGRSDITLITELLKKAIGVIILLITVFAFRSVEAIAWGFSLTAVLATLIDTYPNKKLIDYSYINQAKDICVPIFLSLVMGAIIFPIKLIIENQYILLATQITAGAIIYFALSKILKVDSYIYLLNIIKSYVHKRKKA